METITLGQLIYGHDEEDESPHRRREGQTLLRSATLEGKELAEAEERLVYCPSSENPIKRCFHRLSSGRVMLARLVAEETTEEANHADGFFAHGLILREDDFLAAGGDPDVFFATYPFLPSVREAKKVGDWQSGLIDDRTLAIPWHDDARQLALLEEWPLRAVHNLVLLALRAPALVAGHTPLICQGDAEACYALLSALFLLVPCAARVHCTFDSYCYQCDCSRLPAWALCAPQPTGMAAGQPYLDIDARKVTPDLQPETPFERWICLLIDQQQYDDIIQQQDLMYWFANLLDGRQLRQPDRAREEIPDYYFQQEMPALQAAMVSGLSKKIGTKLAARLAEYFNPLRHREEMTASLFGGFNPEKAPDLLTLAYRQQQFRIPEQVELEQLAQLLSQVPNRGLQLLLDLWSGNTTSARTILAGVSEAEYNQYARIFLTYNVGKPASLIVQPYAPIFVEQFLSLPQRPYPDVDKVVTALLELKAESSLVALTPALEHAEPGTLQTIAKHCRASKIVPKAFHTAVQAQLNRGGGNNINTIVQQLLGKFSGKKN